MKRTAFFSFLLILAASSGFAEEEFSSAEENARRAHQLATSDVIYEQENFKALYYQNQQIIELLKEIREELHNVNMRQAKEGSQA